MSQPTTFEKPSTCTKKIENVVIDLTHAHLWDQSAVIAIDKVVLKFRTHGSTVELVGMNEASTTLMERLVVHNKPDAVALANGH